MRRNFRLAGYLLVMAIVLGSLAASPQAWATPNQTNENQTVPTRTPKPPQPTDPPPQATSAPQPTSPPAPDTPQPQPTATRIGVTPSAVATTVAPARGAALSLVLTASPIQVWPGVIVVYTLTAVNRSTAALRDVVLLVQLPAELQPGAVLSPKEAAWEGTALRAALAELAPGAQAEMVFAAKVAPGVPAGKIIVNRASVSAAGAAAVTAAASVAMPPAELPRVGGGVRDQR